MKLGITPPVLTVVLVTTWTCAVAVASPLPFFTERQEMFWYNHNEVWCADRWPAFFYQTEGVSPHCLTWNPGKRAYYTVYIVCMYFIPILTMVGVYGAILWTLWTRPKDQGATVDAMHQRTRKKVRSSVICMLLHNITKSTSQCFRNISFAKVQSIIGVRGNFIQRA